MFNNSLKIRDNKGFSLMEVMIGMSILTIAIVAATSILIALINSNKNITRTLQAYHLAQEGLEIVRNIRDTNWLNNLEYLGGNNNNIFGNINLGESYVAFVDNTQMGIGDDNLLSVASSSLNQFSPWIFAQYNSSNDNSEICLMSGYFGQCPSACGLPDCAKTEFKRVITIEDYCTEAKKTAGEAICEKFDSSGTYDEKAVVVTSKVTFGNKSDCIF